MDRRLAYLEALEIPVYVRRDAADATGAGGEVAAGATAHVTDPAGEVAGSSRDQASNGERLERGTRPDPAGGVSVDAARAGSRAAPPAIVGDTARATRIAAAGWTDLEATVRDCRDCGLCGSRTQTVFGVGDHGARLMVIGEAPGADEDRQGEPFVGRAGQLLNAMLRAAGFDRSQVYIANVLKCRPPGNRDPRPEEAGQCLPYLHRQIELVAPRLILCVGRVAAQNLLDTDQPLGRMRGRTHPFGARAVPVVVTYHPAYLLRTPGDKRKAWVDLKFALECMRDGHRPGSAGKT